MTTPVPLRGFDRAPAAVLVVSPSEPVRVALARMLAHERSEILSAETAAQALALGGVHRIACAVLDDTLPDLAPAGLAIRMGELEPGACVLLLAGDGAAGVEDGRVVRLEKPVDPIALCAAVDRALRRSDAIRESHQINAWLAEEVTSRTEELHRERENLKQLSVATLEALVNALEAKDPHLRGHSARVADLAGAIAEAMGLPADTCGAVRTAGRLHDIGKIGIPEGVLAQAGPLSAEDFEQIKRHPIVGEQILAPLTHLGLVLGYVRHHHERWDGAGYPDRLQGEAIPIGARIIGAVEIYDALTTSRPYQRTMEPAQAVIRVRELFGSVIDPTIGAALTRCVGGAGASG